MSRRHSDYITNEPCFVKEVWAAEKSGKNGAMAEPGRGLSSGMGSIPDPDGTTFRVWAPNAEWVAVVGTFNGWDDTTDRLEPEDGGYWAGRVETAGVGDEYRFAISNGETFTRIDPYARQVTNSVGNGVIHPVGGYEWLVPDDYRMPPWHEMVIYELHLGTFSTSADGRPGTFESAIKRLDHLLSLGVNVIELMPPMEFAGGRSWGYNPAHPFAIESDYGGPDGLKAFIEAAHSAGIAVIIDVVYNHLGPSDLDLWRFDGWRESDGGGIYFYNDWRRTTPWGDTRPDYGRPEVRLYLRDNALMWLDEYRVDGLRWDMTAYIRNVWGGSDPGADLPDGWSLMQWVNDEIDARFPWKVSIAEDLRDDPVITRPTDDGGAGFDTQWAASFVHPIRAALIEQGDDHRDIAAVAAAITHGPNAFDRVIYTESHDEVANGSARLPEEIWPGNAAGWHARKRATLGAVLVFTSPGVPMIFQGQELLEDRWFSDDDPVDWSLLDRETGTVRLYRDLVALRRNLDGGTHGLTGHHVNVQLVDDRAKLVAFHRWAHGGPGDDVVVVCNFRSEAARGFRLGVPAPGHWRVVFDSDAPVYHADNSGSGAVEYTAETEPLHGMPASLSVDVGPYSAVILGR